MALTDRLPMYRELEDLRQRPLLVYITSSRPQAEGMMAADAIPEFLDQIMLVPQEARSVDVLIVSNGGDPTVAWRIMSLLRERFDFVGVLVPQAAFSAATLMALGADEILMHPNGNLGPTDPQIVSKKGGQEGRNWGAEDLSGFLRFLKEEVGLTDQRHLSRLLERVCKEVGAVSVGFAARATALSSSLGEKLLKMHMKKPEEERKIDQIVDSLNKKYFIHGYPVCRAEATQLGLPILQDVPPRIESLLWSVWCDVENELKMRDHFSIQGVLDANPAVQPVLFGPVPQLNIPPGLAVNMPNIRPVDVPPTSVETVHAIMESPRKASRFVKRGIILASRTPDLKVQVNAQVLEQSWRSVAIP